MSDKPEPNFTMGNLLEELKRRLSATEGGGEFWTSRELALELGIEQHTVATHIRKLYDAGQIAVSRKTMMRMDGRPVAVPAYRLKLPETEQL